MTEVEPNWPESLLPRLIRAANRKGWNVSFSTQDRTDSKSGEVVPYGFTFRCSKVTEDSVLTFEITSIDLEGAIRKAMLVVCSV